MKYGRRFSYIVIIVTAFFSALSCDMMYSDKSAAYMPPNAFNASSGGPLSYTWGTPENAPMSWLDDTADKIHTCNHGMYKATEGQLYMGNQSLSDGTSSVNVIIENLDSWEISSGACACCQWYDFEGRQLYRICLCGNFESDIFLHEFCHGHFRKAAEEYECSVCVMGTYDRNRVTQLSHYCDDVDCTSYTPEGANCWGYILNRFNWTHTNYDPGQAPNNCVFITDKN